MISTAVLDAIPPQDSALTFMMRRLGRDGIEEFVNDLTPLEASILRYEWPLYARQVQRVPQVFADGLSPTWVILGGRGMGKTRVGAEQVIDWSRELGQDYGGGRIALVAKDPADARKVMIEGESGILACSPPWWRPTWYPAKKELHWDNGVIAFVYSSEDPDDLRGPQHHKAWGDEIGKWKNVQDVWDMLAFGMRLGVMPQVLLTTTPRPVPALIQILEDPSTVVTRGTTDENRANLPVAFLDRIYRKYKGTRLGRQELNAELLQDTPGALWTLGMIEQSRVQKMPADLVRVVIGVDPSANDGEDDDLAETGIVAAGIGPDGAGYVLHDLSDHLSPARWGARVVNHYVALKADAIVAETNNGGAMVEHVIKVAAKAAGVWVNVIQVTASRGKRTRAEPISALYEQGRVHHVSLLAELEDQMSTWTPGADSPDRLDALVWALSELMLKGVPELALV